MFLKKYILEQMVMLFCLQMDGVLKLQIPMDMVHPQPLHMNIFLQKAAQIHQIDQKIKILLILPAIIKAVMPTSGNHLKIENVI